MGALRSSGLDIEWWCEGDDFVVHLCDRPSGSSGVAFHEVFADAVAEACDLLAEIIVADWNLDEPATRKAVV